MQVSPQVIATWLEKWSIVKEQYTSCIVSAINLYFELTSKLINTLCKVQFKAYYLVCVFRGDVKIANSI